MAAAQMALGIELEKKRDAAQMSAAAVSFFLDREGHKKFLRTATNQELEVQNTALKAHMEEIKEANDHRYNVAMKGFRERNALNSRCLDLERELDTTKQHLDYFKKSINEERHETAELHAKYVRTLRDKYVKTLRDKSDLELKCVSLESRISHLEELAEIAQRTIQLPVAEI